MGMLKYNSGRNAGLMPNYVCSGKKFRRPANIFLPLREHSSFVRLCSQAEADNKPAAEPDAINGRNEIDVATALVSDDRRRSYYVIVAVIVAPVTLLATASRKTMPRPCNGCARRRFYDAAYSLVRQIRRSFSKPVSQRL